MLLADVSGKGIDAAVNTAFVKYSIRALASEAADPSYILERFNTLFTRTIADPSLFVVLFLGLIDTEKMQLDYASAGHSAAYLRHAGEVRQLPVTGPIIGLGPSTFTTQTVPLVPGDTLVLATDGLTEARKRDGSILDDSGAMAIVARGAADPQSLADQVAEIATELSCGELGDDLAVLVVRVDDRAGRARSEAA